MANFPHPGSPGTSANKNARARTWALKKVLILHNQALVVNLNRMDSIAQIKVATFVRPSRTDTNWVGGDGVNKRRLAVS